MTIPDKTKDVLASEIVEILEAMAEHDKNIDDTLSNILEVFERVTTYRIKELEDACVHYAAREEQMIDMLQRIGTIVDEEDDEYAM